MEKQNVKVKLPVAKTKYQELYVGFLFFFFFGGYNNFVILLPIIAEIVFFFPLKNNTHTEKEGDGKKCAAGLSASWFLQTQ